MDLINVIKGRQSTRWFTDKKIPINTLLDIIKLAQQAPSWVNSQPIRVYLAMGNTLDKIKQEHAKLNQSPKIQSNPVIPFRSTKQWDQASQNNMNNWFAGNCQQVGSNWFKVMGKVCDRLYNANAVVYLSLHKNFSDWSVLDLGSFSQTIMLAAYNKEVASLPAYQFVQYPNHLHELLNLPDDEEVVFGIGLGYRDEKAPINRIHSTRMKTNQILKVLK